MFEKITKKTHPREWAIILKALPSYRKRSAYLSFQDKVSLSGRYWDGGSRTVWHIITGSLVNQVPSRSDFPFTAPPDTEIDLANPNDGAKVMVISSGTFCGKPSTAHLYLSESKALEQIKKSSLEIMNLKESDIEMIL